MRKLLQPPAAGDALTYEAALGRIAADLSPVWPLHVQPQSVEAVLLVLMEALATGREVTFYDADFSAEELTELTGSPVLPDAGVPRQALVIADWEAWLALVARNASVGFKLGLFTSGSTGLPKRVVHSWASLSRGLRVSTRHENDVWGLAYNPTHIAGIQVILQALMNGNPLIDLWRRSREEQIALLETHGVTHLSATPSFYRLLLPLEKPNLTVKRISLGGEGSDETLRARLREAFPNAKIGNIYASTEAGSLFMSDGGVFKVPGLLHDKVRVRDDCLELHRSLLADFPGIGPDDWYATGDRVEVVSQEPLAFRILGRERDWLNVGGAKVNPHEVEEALLSYPGVTAARVSGRPNSVLGTLVQAEVVSVGAVDESALRAHLSSHLQAFKVPRLIKFVESLGRGRTGKLAR